MALVVEDGTGKPTAESYLSVLSADAYHLVHSISTDWSGATTAAKEAALRLATQYLDATYKNRWIPVRNSDEQSLDWPRAGLVIDDVVYDASDLPQQLLDATAELALKVVEGDVIFADMSDGGLMLSQTVRVGPITKSKTYAGGSGALKRYRLVDALVDPLVVKTGGVERS